MSLMLPVGCNATCPNICYTDAEHWHRNMEHLTTTQIHSLITQFAHNGGRLVRIIGDGEPLLYRQLPMLCQWIRALNMHLVVFSNGLLLPPSFIAEYQRGNVSVYIKLWSERQEKQQKLVSPRIPYQYRTGEVGSAPKNFYALREIDPLRAGFQVLVSSMNEPDAREICEGSKQTVPLSIEDFTPAGAGKGHTELLPGMSLPETKGCSMPPRASYLAVINSSGALQQGTFVPQEAVSVVNDELLSTWASIFASHPDFFEARYTGGCHCRNTLVKKRL